jgi:hypothetical protein
MKARSKRLKRGINFIKESGSYMIQNNGGFLRIRMRAVIIAYRT